jgi:hypothetical protein
MIPAIRSRLRDAQLWFIGIIVMIGAVLVPMAPAFAAENLIDVEKHELPTHKLTWSDTLDTVVDLKNQNVCYVARQSDSHAMQMQCLPIRK